jgi:hypothetical protein
LGYLLLGTYTRPRFEEVVTLADDEVELVVDDDTSKEEMDGMRLTDVVDETEGGNELDNFYRLA